MTQCLSRVQNVNESKLFVRISNWHRKLDELTVKTRWRTACANVNGLVVNVWNVGEDQSVIFKISDKGTLELAAAVVEAPPRVCFENIGVDARVLQKQMEPPFRGSWDRFLRFHVGDEQWDAEQIRVNNIAKFHNNCFRGKDRLFQNGKRSLVPQLTFQVRE